MKTNRLFVAAAFVVAACSVPEEPKIDMIEIHASGWVGYNIIVRTDGSGEFEYGYPETTRHSFRLKPGQYERLASDIRPWLREAKPVPVSQAGWTRLMEYGECPKPETLIRDAGALYLHWKGPKLDVYRLVELGCDTRWNSERYRRLEAAVDRLPIRPFVDEAVRMSR